MKKLTVIMLLAVASTNCSMTPIQPWDRDLLAKPEMALLDKIDSAFDDHIYFSKEASSGGQSFAGGGCGCN